MRRAVADMAVYVPFLDFVRAYTLRNTGSCYCNSAGRSDYEPGLQG